MREPSDTPSGRGQVARGVSAQENRWKAFLDVSRIFATERGAERYRLVTHAVGALHERYLRIDGGRHSMLGGSSKHAGTKASFSVIPADRAVAGPEVQAKLDGGRELFGPATPVHA